jgi:peptidyl-tRNA hydrolase
MSAKHTLGKMEIWNPTAIKRGETQIEVGTASRFVAVFGVPNGGDALQDRANAERFVSMWNSHDALVAALDMAHEWINEARDKANLPVSQTLAQIRSALAAAREVTP